MRIHHLNVSSFLHASCRCTRAYLLQLLLIHMHQLIDRRWLAVEHALHCLNNRPDQALATDGVRDRLALDLDNRDSWVVWTTIVCAIVEIAEPDFQCRAVELVNLLLVGEDARFAGHRGPFAGTVEEAEVNIRAVFEVVGFA